MKRMIKRRIKRKREGLISGYRSKVQEAKDEGQVGNILPMQRKKFPIQTIN